MQNQEDLFSPVFTLPESMINELPYISDDLKNYIKTLQFKVAFTSIEEESKKNIITGTIYQKNPDYKNEDRRSKKYIQIKKNNGKPLKIELITSESKKKKMTLYF